MKSCWLATLQHLHLGTLRNWNLGNMLTHFQLATCHIGIHMNHQPIHQVINISIYLVSIFSVILDKWEYIKIGTKYYCYVGTLLPIFIGSYLSFFRYKLISMFIGLNTPSFIDQLKSIYIETKRPIYQGTNIPMSMGRSTRLPEPDQNDWGNRPVAWLTSGWTTLQPPALIHRWRPWVCTPMFQ